MSLHPQQARAVLALLWPHAIDAGASRLHPPRCPCCGGDLALDVHEVWDQRDFLLDACCEGAHERAVDLLNQDPRQAAELLRLLDIDGLCGHRLRRVAEDEGAGRLVLDWRLEIRPVRYSTARDFVRQHHAHCASPPPGWKFGAGAFNGPDLIGVFFPQGRNTYLPCF